MSRYAYGSKAGGERAAAIYSIIETCKLNGVEPFAYISGVMQKIAEALWPDALADSPNPRTPVNKMIVFGHSLGGNLFATGLQDWIKLKVEDSFVTERENIRRPLNTREGLFRDGIDYDWAPHDLFPMFEFDFRPLALWLDRKSARIEKRSSPADSCDETEPSFLHRLESAPIRALSKLARNFPFQNTNQELSHTIGNLDPPRPAGGVLVNKRLVSATPFGTTHELFGLDENHAEKHNPYMSLADAPIVCPPANHWLSRARSAQPPQGTNWDTRKLAQATDPVGEGAPAVQFLHGFNLAGQQPITRANDPFWNMRAFDNVLSRHDGYRLSSFICAMNQLVMDDITQSPPPKPEVAAAPDVSEPSVVKPDAVQPP